MVCRKRVEDANMLAVLKLPCLTELVPRKKIKSIFIKALKRLAIQHLHRTPLFRMGSSESQTNYKSFSRNAVLHRNPLKNIDLLACVIVTEIRIGKTALSMLFQSSGFSALFRRSLIDPEKKQ